MTHQIFWDSLSLHIQGTTLTSLTSLPHFLNHIKDEINWLHRSRLYFTGLVRPGGVWGQGRGGGFSYQNQTLTSSSPNHIMIGLSCYFAVMVLVAVLWHLWIDHWNLYYEGTLVWPKVCDAYQCLFGRVGSCVSATCHSAAQDYSNLSLEVRNIKNVMPVIIHVDLKVYIYCPL